MQQAEARRAIRWPLRAMSTIVLIVLVATTLTSAYLAKRVVDDTENRLLKERTAEVAQLFNVAVSSVQASLGSAGAVASSSQADPAAFRTYAQRLLASKANPTGFAALALVKSPQSSPVLVTALGSGVDAARLREPEVTAALARAQSGFVVTQVLGSGANLRLGYVLGPPAAPAGYAIYAEQPIAPYASVDAPRASGTPFNELTGAIYASTTPDVSQVLTSSERQLPLRGNVERQTIKVGTGEWLIEIKARGSLVGGVTRWMPALLLGLGLAVTIVLTGIVEVLGRRRRYAERLVAERTQDLRDSLEQLERAQQQVVLSERLAAIGQVASTVGHELRNPLGVVANAAYLIRLRTTDTSALRQLDTLDREVQSAARISSDLLDFARVRTPEWTDVDVHALISEVLSVVPHHGGVTITRDEDRDLGSIRADPDQLRQVLLNLVTNACEALPEGGTVTVAVHRVDGAMRIDVADTGLGMDEVTQARLFEPFFTTKTRGTGLGLAVCKRLVDAHGGSISVVSARGEGTRFTVNLPRVPTAARPPTDAPATAILGTHE